jgi:hypothetical protein
MAQLSVNELLLSLPTILINPAYCKFFLQAKLQNNNNHSLNESVPSALINALGTLFMC